MRPEGPGKGGGGFGGDWSDNNLVGEIEALDVKHLQVWDCLMVVEVQCPSCL